MRVLFDAKNRYLRALPRAPQARRSPDKITTPLDDAANIWFMIEEAGKTFELAGNYALGQFSNDIAQLKETYRAYTMAVTEEKVARGARNETQERIYPILKQYREVISTFFAADSAIVATLPRLTPKAGATPQPVNASAVWDEGAAQARLAWDASDNSHVKEYQVRYTPGDRYEEDDASVVTNIAPDAPGELLTTAGLTQSGAESTFKIYVVLTTGNEAGSEGLTVKRPSGP